jgi:phosphohistidine phosphatase
MKNLFFLRHAKAEHATGGADIRRSLTKRGKNDALRMADFLTRLSPGFDRIFVSTAIRTRETIEAFLDQNPDLRSGTTYADLLYQFNASAYRMFIHEELSDDDNVVLLVGHNNAIEQLVTLLNGEDQNYLRVSTCTLVHFEFDVDSWKDIAGTTGKLKNYVKARSEKK